MVFQLFLVKQHLVLVSIKHDWAIHLCYLSPFFLKNNISLKLLNFFRNAVGFD